MQTAKLVGGPGTGKTHELLRTMEKMLERGVHPLEIGFVSFTRAARLEASTRAAELFGCERSQLETQGYFKTLHAICYSALQVSQESLILNNKESREWLQNAVEDEIPNVDEDTNEASFYEQTPATKALQLWSKSRNSLKPLKDVWKQTERFVDLPGFEWCQNIALKYEYAKKADGRLDFNDLIGRFTGHEFGLDEHKQCKPEGNIPGVTAWIHDECQDSSALLDAAFRRLISAPTCKWCYAAADPWQSLYNWAGADHRHFLNLPYDKQRVMDQSYRCPREIMHLAENILKHNQPDYFDRKIQPAEHNGTIQIENSIGAVVEQIKPKQDWLLLARTNRLCGRIARFLDVASIPWQPIRGRGGWNAPKRMRGVQTLIAIENGEPIDGHDWKALIDLLPVKTKDGIQLLESGTKTRFKSKEECDQILWMVTNNELKQLGATDALLEIIRNKKCDHIIKTGKHFLDGLRRYGVQATGAPQVRVGTIHSAKGMEAENVGFLTSITLPIYRGREDKELRAAEARCAYVAITRAKRRLVIINDIKAKFMLDVHTGDCLSIDRYQAMRGM